MTEMECGVVVMATDEEDVIERCLESLQNQKVKLFLVVVNDGSVDRTDEIALSYADVVVYLDRYEESWARKPELARVFNAGFKVLEENDVEYILVSGADAVYPHYYVEETIQNVNKDNVVLSSGVAQGEKVRDDFPTGCRRFTQSARFRNIEFRFPDIFVFKAYPIFKALSRGEGFFCARAKNSSCLPLHMGVLHQKTPQQQGYAKNSIEEVENKRCKIIHFLVIWRRSKPAF